MAEFSITALYSYLFSYVAPPFPLPEGTISADGLKSIPVNVGKQLLGRVPFQQLPRVIRESGVQEVAPLALHISGEAGWKLPIEPIVEVRGANKVVRRHAQRSGERGTYKEYWQADDLTIVVKGVFIGEEKAQPPTEEIVRFKEHMQAASFSLYSPVLDPLGVELVVATDWQLPHTPGINNQGYVFRCYSDRYDYKLLSDA